MRLKEIQDQLREYLPLNTDLFNDWIDSTFSAAGTTVTVTTGSDHGLVVGDIVNVSDVEFRNALASLESVDGTAYAVTTSIHDLTEGFSTVVEIEGAVEPEFNGEFPDDIFIKDRNNIQYSMEPRFDGTATGSPVLVERNLVPFTGQFEVTSVIDSTNYTFEIYADFGTFTSTCRTANNNSRIGVAFDLDHAKSMYTPQDLGDYWLFIMPEPTTVSANRDINSDFTVRWWNGEEYKQEIQESVTILVIAKANEKITPVDIIDTCRIDIRNAINLSMVGYEPTRSVSSKYSNIGYLGDEPADWDKSMYIHAYTYSSVVQLSTDDTFTPRSVALQEFTANYFDNDTNNKQLIATDNNKY